MALALINKFHNVLLNICIPKFQPSVIYSSSDCNSKSPCEDSQKIQCSDSEEINTEEKCSPPQSKRIIQETAEEIRKKQLQKCKIVLREPENYSLISGLPLEVTCFQVARVYKPTKNAMQSGTRNIGHWEVVFGTKERWENPLMGWCASGDPLSNVGLTFLTKEDAIEYCKKNSINYWVQENYQDKKFKLRSYAMNFHYSNKMRVSTK